MEPWASDVRDADFESEVLERSKALPVVVDFWAPWCGPCRVLGPVLERLAAAHAGQFVLAKVNVDENPVVAQTFGIRGIPAVKAFRDGRIVDEFVGALPEDAVRGFLARLLPTEADRFVAQAAAAERRSAEEEAEALYRRALELDVNHPAARLGLGRILVRRDPQAGLAELEQVLQGTPERAEADRIAARARLAQDGANGRVELESRLAADPEDLESRLGLARLLAAEEQYEAGLAHLLEVVRRDRRYGEEAARRAMLDIFEILGPNHALTERYRSELAGVLFS